MELLTILIYVCIVLTVIFIISSIYTYFKLRNVGGSTLDFTQVILQINAITQLVLDSSDLEATVKNILY